jgi:hypothetical protein
MAAQPLTVLEGTIVSSLSRDPQKAVADVSGSGGGGGATTYYKMRGVSDPAPGYVSWVVATTPDFAGASAPDPVQVSTIVIVAEFE